MEPKHLEYEGLLHGTFSENIPLHIFRGYCFKGQSIEICSKVSFVKKFKTVINSIAVKIFSSKMLFSSEHKVSFIVNGGLHVSFKYIFSVCAIF